MKRLSRILRRAALAFTIALILVAFLPAPASAQSLSEYFNYTTSVTFSKSSVTGTETFNATVTADAECKKDLPFSVSEASITGRIVAENQDTGARVTLNSSYNLSINPFPDDTGETASVEITVPLRFPSGSVSGTYTVIAELVEARVRTLGVWLPVTSYLSSEQVAGTVSFASGSTGGGGGGGGAPATKVSISGLTSTRNLTVNSQGIVQDMVRLQVAEADAFLDIAQGTKMLTSGGSAITSLSASLVSSPQQTPEGKAVVAAIDFKPDGATFKPAITLVMDFDPTSLPEGMETEGLYIAYWNGSQWRALPSTLNMSINRLSAKVSHFTQFAILGSVPVAEAAPGEPASPPDIEVETAIFNIRALSIVPEKVELGQTATLSAVLSNTGNSRGSYTVVLKINGSEMDETRLILDAGAEYTVSFEVVTEGVGTYEVDINGLTGSFTVVEPAPEITESAQPAREPIAAQTPQEPASAPAINWWLIGGIAAAVILVGGVVVFVVVRMRY